MATLTIFVWLVAVLSVLGRRWIGRLIERRFTGRTLFWKVRVLDGLRLQARRKRLRLYGIVTFDGGARVGEAARALAEAIDGRRVRLRIVGRDPDGTLIVVVRCGGANPALALLRSGLVATPVTVARAYREAMIWARCRGRGNWRVVDKWPPEFVGFTVEVTPTLEYRYG
jgi:endonuclease YncB( thermonuclease family)